MAAVVLGPVQKRMLGLFTITGSTCSVMAGVWLWCFFFQSCSLVQGQGRKLSR